MLSTRVWRWRCAGPWVNTDKPNGHLTHISEHLCVRIEKLVSSNVNYPATRRQPESYTLVFSCLAWTINYRVEFRNSLWGRWHEDFPAFETSVQVFTKKSEPRSRDRNGGHSWMPLFIQERCDGIRESSSTHHMGLGRDHDWLWGWRWRWILRHLLGYWQRLRLA
jgi:hypothetical protein